VEGLQDFLLQADAPDASLLQCGRYNTVAAAAMVPD
jgi:hypothetical protein